MNRVVSVSCQIQLSHHVSLLHHCVTGNQPAATVAGAATVEGREDRLWRRHPLLRCASLAQRAAMPRSEKVRLAQRAAREARREGDDEAAVLWLGVAIRELRAAEGSEENELLSELLVSRGSARQRLPGRCCGKGATRERAIGFADGALSDFIEATRRTPAMARAHRKRIRVTLSSRRALPELLSLCADVHDAMGLGIDPGAVQWQLSQLEPEPQQDCETNQSGGEAAVVDTSHARAAAVSAVLAELERTIVTELVQRHATYEDSLASVASAVAYAAQGAAQQQQQQQQQQQRAQFGVVLSGTRQEQQRQEAAALWALLRLAQPQDLAVCADNLCRRLVAHIEADISEMTAGAGCQKGTDTNRELILRRCKAAVHLIEGLRQIGLQVWCVESQQLYRPIASRHCLEPVRAYRLAQHAARAEDDANAAELRALLLRASAAPATSDVSTDKLAAALAEEAPTPNRISL